MLCTFPETSNFIHFVDIIMFHGMSVFSDNMDLSSYILLVSVAEAFLNKC